jgi:ferritin
MIKDNMLNALNEQIAREMYSSNLYLSMAGYYQSINLPGFAHWMRVQAQEEMFHATKFFDYILNRGGKPKIAAIAEPQAEWKSALDAFDASFKHEQYISESINTLADIAIKETDHATLSMLQWFITEQVEEEANVSEIVEKLKLLGDFTAGIIMMDNELKARPAFAPPKSNT